MAKGTGSSSMNRDQLLAGISSAVQRNFSSMARGNSGAPQQGNAAVPKIENPRQRGNQRTDFGGAKLVSLSDTIQLYKEYGDCTIAYEVASYGKPGVFFRAFRGSAARSVPTAEELWRFKRDAEATAKTDKNVANFIKDREADFRF